MKPYQWTARMNYRYRVGSFLMLFAILGSHLLARGLGTWAWGALVLQFLLYPHVLYGVTRNATDLPRAELNNLLLDSFLFGIWAAALGLPVWISFTLYASTLVNNGIYRGVPGIGWSILASIAGTALGLVGAGLPLFPDTSVTTTVLCIIGLGIHLALTSSIANARNQALYDTRTQLKASQQSLLEANQELRQQMAAKTRFLAYAGHDLRQPLQAIHLFLADLAETHLSAQQKQDVELAQASSGALENLLDSLLNISKLDAGAVQPELRPLDVDILLADVEREFAAQAHAKGLRFKLCLPRDVVTVASDGYLLAAVLRNLVSNAIKYTRHGGVLLALRQANGRARVQVWDSGVGISAEDQKFIFEEFYQVDNPQRDRTRGLGLGLAIVKRISDLLDLQVTCCSRPGQGTVMEVSLPRAPAMAKPPPPQVEDGAGADLQGLHVLLLEDAIEVALAQTAWLNRPGFRGGRLV